MKREEAQNLLTSPELKSKISRVVTSSNAKYPNEISPSSPAYASPDDIPSVSLEDAVRHVGGDLANQYGYTGSGQTVAVIDTGVVSGNSKIASRVIGEACFMTANAAKFGNAGATCATGSTESIGDGSASTEDPHGSSVMEVIAGPDGVAPLASLLAVRVVSDQGRAESADLARSLDFLLRRAYDTPGSLSAINLSLGFGFSPGTDACKPNTPDEQLVAEEIEMLRSLGVMTVAAAGNDYSNSGSDWKKQGLNFPACLDTVVSVGNSEIDDTIFEGYEYNNTGEDIASSNFDATFSSNSMSLWAPGTGVILSGQCFAGVCNSTPFSGTSQAAPFVAGAVVLIKQAWANVRLSRVEELLENSGPLVTNKINGVSKHRLDIAESVRAALGITPTVDHTPVWESRIVPVKSETQRNTRSMTTATWNSLPFAGPATTGQSWKVEVDLNTGRGGHLVYPRIPDPSVTFFGLSSGGGDIWVTASGSVRVDDEISTGSPTKVFVTAPPVRFSLPSLSNQCVSDRDFLSFPSGCENYWWPSYSVITSYNPSASMSYSDGTNASFTFPERGLQLAWFKNGQIMHSTFSQANNGSATEFPVGLLGREDYTSEVSMTVYLFQGLELDSLAVAVQGVQGDFASNPKLQIEKVSNFGGSELYLGGTSAWRSEMVPFCESTEHSCGMPAVLRLDLPTAISSPLPGYYKFTFSTRDVT